VAVIFPRWTNQLPAVAVAAVTVLGTLATVAAWYWFSPWFTDVGYAPDQPVAYSHRLHAGQLGMDCRYCHDTVERSSFAAVPPAATCMNCHKIIRTESPLLEPIREAAAGGDAVAWVRVHLLPDYASFDHSVHVGNGVGCESCHGRIDQMDVVQQQQPLSMSWCLDCHKDPTPFLRPLDKVTVMGWDGTGYDPPADPARKRMPNPPKHCSGCHR